MELGGFSISLAVKDIEKSKVFYEKLGFKVFAGDQSQNYLIMKNGSNNIGLFQGMFEENIITFNPGWDHEANKIKSFEEQPDLFVLNGKYGPYIKQGKANFKIPKDLVAEDLELKDCLDIIKNQPKKTRGKKKAKK